MPLTVVGFGHPVFDGRPVLQNPLRAHSCSYPVPERARGATQLNASEIAVEIAVYREIAASGAKREDAEEPGSSSNNKFFAE
jgi:hypothetical protein